MLFLPIEQATLCPNHYSLQSTVQLVGPKCNVPSAKEGCGQEVAYQNAIEDQHGKSWLFRIAIKLILLSAKADKEALLPARSCAACVRLVRVSVAPAMDQFVDEDNGGLSRPTTASNWSNR